MGRMFGTDGVRGVANSPELDSILAYSLGRAGSYVLSKENNHKSVIFVGKDTRASGDMLEAALVSGICSTGAKAVLLGVIPTPAVAYLTRKYGADAGVVISASHNPVEFNGIKFFNSKGYKLCDEIEDEIESVINSGMTEVPSPVAEDVGRVERLDAAIDEYVDFAISTVNTRFDGLKIALDCACGASSISSPKAFEKMGAKVLTIHNDPDGTNINKKCGSTHMESLCKFVKENGCDLGLAFDGDADRMLAVNENGEVVDGDVIMAICAMELKKKGKLKNNALVATIMSNMGLFIFGEKNGIDVPRTKVGDRYVLEEMLEKGYCIGGEQSGHIIFLDHNTTGDGLISGLQLVQIVKNSGKSLKKLSEIVTILPQVLVNAKLGNKGKSNIWSEDEEISYAIKDVENKLSGKGRVLIRPSGTEPLIRVMIEGPELDTIDKDCHMIASLIEEKAN
ncbi:MAG: phosphoglucosamine mutase [Bacillota bacterium]|nr:phosphoglucosamine mutase [Bacillota bacterium]